MISIVIPIFNEGKVLSSLFKELDSVSDSLSSIGDGIEVVLVNDGSSDESWDLISARCLNAPNYIGVNLSRNFGHQAALVAGLETATGDIVVSLDADLQDPPSLILKLVQKHLEGFDVVYATRIGRGEESWVKRLTAQWFYSTLQKISGVQILNNTGDFRLMSRKAVREFVNLHETHRFLRGLAPWIGFRQGQVFYDRADRKVGTTHYSMRKMLNLAFDGITSMSRAPLRLAYVLCLILFGIYIGYIIWVAIDHFVMGSALVPGWTSIMGAITIFGTIQLLSLGIFGDRPHGENQFTLWPQYDPNQYPCAIYVADRTNAPPAVLLQQFPCYKRVDDFWSQHKGRPMNHFVVYLCEATHSKPD